MQELQPTPGLVGRLLGGGGAAGLFRRRSRPGTPEAAEVRCPRCDSANTKFCYYNNYNLAQPRHFCRACRRYWTKGGLLRNVPVGGGCRKPKRKRPAADAGKNGDVAHRDAKNPRSGSAGASSSAADAPVTSHASSVAARPSVTRSSSVVDTSAATGPFAAGDTLPPPLPHPAPMFADQAAAFASLFAPLPLPAVSFSAQPKAEEGVNTVLAELPASTCTSAAPDTTPFAVQSGGGLTTRASGWPQWASESDTVIFELTGAIVGDASLTAYWNTGSWTHPDPGIYLP